MGRADKALKQVLEKYGISQNQLALTMGIALANVSRWVSEDRDPLAEAAAEIKDALNKLDLAAAEEFAMLYLYRAEDDSI